MRKHYRTTIARIAERLKEWSKPGFQSADSATGPTDSGASQGLLERDVRTPAISITPPPAVKIVPPSPVSPAGGVATVPPPPSIGAGRNYVVQKPERRAFSTSPSVRDRQRWTDIYRLNQSIPMCSRNR